MPQWGLARCQNGSCRKLVLFSQAQDGTVHVLFPLAVVEFPNDSPIPAEIQNDFKEAGLCLSAGCYKASLVMSRRVLQRCIKEQGVTDRNLSDAISTAVANGTLRKAFHELATEIRAYGNLSAHPDDDQLQNANRDSASTVLSFAQLLIHEFYEVPASAALLKKNRKT